MRGLSLISRSLRRFRDDERGMALLEFAMVVPIMLAFFAVTVEGGRMMWAYQAATANVRDASRYVAMAAEPGICNLDPAERTARLNALETRMETRLNARMVQTRNYFQGGTTFDGVSIVCEDIFDPTLPDPATSVDFDLLELTATISIDFPFGGIFALVSERTPTAFTADISDQHRVLGL